MVVQANKLLWRLLIHLFSRLMSVIKYMKKIYIVGSSGLIGQDLQTQLDQKKIKYIGTYCKNKKRENEQFFDMLQQSKSEFTKKLEKKSVVFLLSAYSNPSWIYLNKKEAKKLNLESTKELIEKLVEKESRIIFMSSVEVFNGEKGNYNEDDEPNPLNYYGELKLEIEEFLNKTTSSYTIVRTGWNVGMNNEKRCVVRLTYESLLKNDPKMAKDNVFSIITSKNTAEALEKLISYENIKKIHLASDNPVIRTELAKSVLNESKNIGLNNFTECLFKEIKYSEPRARLNDLDNSFAKNILNLRFTSTEEIIKQKTHLLDRIYLG